MAIEATLPDVGVIVSESKISTQYPPQLLVTLRSPTSLLSLLMCRAKQNINIAQKLSESGRRLPDSR
ncbi:hypothetical protein Pse7367_0940 [Thalassoporum mexicanum PCC 7367]|nr:hypothetical protein Pse7367_0940 [Pseudanabaena sp. PCC 7367]